MAKVQINKNTWLNFADLFSFFGIQGTSGIVENPATVTFWDTPNFPAIVPQSDDVFINIDDVYLGRLDLVAYDYYGDPDLWWVVALANGYDLIPTDMLLNTLMRIPSPTYVNSIIAKGAHKV